MGASGSSPRIKRRSPSSTADGKFFADAVDVEVTFDREGETVTGLTLTQNGKELAAKKTG